VPAVVLAFAVRPVKGLLTVALFCLAHFIEGNFVTPLAERRIVKLPPFLTLSLQLILAPATGALGVALAAPLLAVTMSVVRVLVPAHLQSSSAPGPAKRESQTIVTLPS
jgi:predicted PurR-regulated permease PerM